MYDYGIGHTPLIELPSINGNRLFIKIESQNFLGSIKSRTGYALVNGLEVPRDCVIVETSSGNLCLALDYFCKEMGRPFFCLLDETIVPAKLDNILSQGVHCEIVPTEPGLDARTSRMKRADALVSAGTHFWVNQCDNEDGVMIHQQTTGPEIYEQTAGAVTSVFCAVAQAERFAALENILKTMAAK
jgi:cysteine synthase